MYVSRPQPVSAMQWTGTNWRQLRAWFEQLNVAAVLSTTGNPQFMVKLQTEMMTAEIKKTDWIICNQNNVVFMAHDDAFHQHYVAVDEVLDPEGGSHERPLGY